jgi:hypothetical protein
MNCPPGPVRIRHLRVPQRRGTNEFAPQTSRRDWLGPSAAEPGPSMFVGTPGRFAWVRRPFLDHRPPFHGEEPGGISGPPRLRRTGPTPPCGLALI